MTREERNDQFRRIFILLLHHLSHARERINPDFEITIWLPEEFRGKVPTDVETAGDKAHIEFI